MKKIVLSIVATTSLAMVSCSEKGQGVETEADLFSEDSPACDCTDQMLEVSKKMKDAGDDVEKSVAAMKEMETIMKNCEPIFQKLDEEMKDLPDKEKDVARKAFMESCPSAKVLGETKINKY